ncbi:hypothetical protein PHYBLDRAFT_185013 [Phycomyces blakesleeanus NRRL 1555(-)]|uniref:Uncharacterized protein n=1 Tax=Phycomyces blakesleeanus (strain ATCC 8743b / DSM 1359 / FGSC 10004 / NBRC 33097 / NRRL 1555) TaxID=763407 RepID=A0A167QP42_PHYB8|nr:hypothetical protein PHYBLDRAFT_185013 [Phycomyces blakesleeanus NRRL 1555(-)]OAD79991.1 hypothetical protein PHYBLDRAFT_185013 [Phycomyces blakesleeanus NRRL 1555(-)]|eukprot:XP_018298031.1 hypothetical protein PHYBLDRAFT_185013 [Phycomyces blakesleeanus NRRL 1555(-)]
MFMSYNYAYNNPLMYLILCYCKMLPKKVWDYGPMDKASDYESGDSSLVLLSFLIWDGLPFTIAKSKGQTHWGSESIYVTVVNLYKTLLRFVIYEVSLTYRTAAVNYPDFSDSSK